MNWFRNSRIKTKLLTAFASVIMIVLVESAVTFRAVSTAEHTREQMLNAQRRNDKFRDFQTSLHQIEIGFTSFVLTGAPDAYQLYQDAAKRVDEQLPDLKQSAAHDKDPQLLVAIAELEQDKRSFVEQAVAPTLKSRERMSQGDGTYETVVATLLGSQGFAVIQSANHTVNQLIDQLGQERDRAAAANASASASIQQTMIASTLAAIAIAFGIAFWLADFISGNLRQLLKASHALSEGDTSVKIEIDWKDELGDLAANFRALVDYNRRIGVAAEALERGDLNVAIVPASDRDRTAKELNKAMESIREVMCGVGRSASSLAAAAEQLTSTSKTMTINAQQTSQRVFSVSSASEEIGCNIHSVASAAEEMSTSIREIASSASDAAKVAGEAVDAASKANATMSRLGESSVRIGEIVKLITGIAGQTHLLALNATIEAARAGAAGKGFAVVANEVKELAKETAKATEDIGRKIEIIQSDSRDAVEAISAIGDTIGRISGLQTTIAGAVQQQTQTTNEISRSTSDVANGSGEITRSIAAVAAAAQSTSEGASYTERAALELSRMATELQEFVSRFHYGEMAQPGAARAAAGYPARMVQ